MHNFASARVLARRALPRPLFDFIDGGADDEITLRENHAVFTQVTFRPRVGLSIPDPDLTATVLGAQLSMPLVLAPCGGSRLVYPDGERAFVRAAGQAGTAATLSTASSTAVEDVAAAASGPLWFQLYYRGDREATAALLDRVKAAGFGALFITLDMPLRGNQERVRSNERIVPPPPTLANAVRYGPQLALHPRWTAGYLRDGMLAAGHHARQGGSPRVPDGPRARRPNVTWADVEWVRQHWTGPYVVKGVLSAADARRAVNAGADGIAVSNHGGRQLDTAPTPLRVLPGIREAVGDKIEVLVDGGVRRGSDVVKAVALGADAVMIGRPYLYGLAVGGEAGVLRVLELFRDDLVRTMRLIGQPAVQGLDATVVDTEGAWPVRPARWGG